MNEFRNECIICGKAVNGFGMICGDCKEAIEWAKRCMETSKKQQEGYPFIKLQKEELVEDEPEEGTVDEMTYEQALGIILSQVDLVESEENKMCKAALEEAIERLRGYERDYANELVDEFMSKTVITGTARKSTEPPITTAICPHCNGHHTEKLYETATLSSERNDFCLHYKCLDCGKEFDKKFQELKNVN